MDDHQRDELRRLSLQQIAAVDQHRASVTHGHMRDVLTVAATEGMAAAEARFGVVAVRSVATSCLSIIHADHQQTEVDELLAECGGEADG